MMEETYNFKTESVECASVAPTMITLNKELMGTIMQAREYINRINQTLFSGGRELSKPECVENFMQELDFNVNNAKNLLEDIEMLEKVLL